MLMYKYPAGVVETGTQPQMKIHLITCQKACEQEWLRLNKISSAILVTVHLRLIQLRDKFSTFTLKQYRFDS